MLISNFSKKKFESIFYQNICNCSGPAIDICVGYYDEHSLRKYGPMLVSCASKGTTVRLILGMYSSGGALSPAKQKELINWHNQLQAKSSGSGVYVCTSRYHGKIYDFTNELWLGSANFSTNGLEKQREAMIEVKDSSTLNEVRDYIKRLVAYPNSVTVNNLKQPNSSFKRGSTASYSTLPMVTSLPANLQLDGSMDLPLRVDKQPESGLNLSLGKGRLNKGTYTARPWYEVEISSDQSVRSNQLYPQIANTAPQRHHQKKRNQCEFRAYLYDGKNYRYCKLQTYSDYNKAMGSTPRTILGEFIKGQLEKAHLLKSPDAITEDMLNAYGRTSIKLSRYTDTSKKKNSKLTDKVFVLDFSRP